MRKRHAVALAALLLALPACDTRGQTHGAPSAAPRPSVQVVNRTEQAGTGSVDLILPGATTSSAQTAIRHYAATIHGPSLYYIRVLRAESASRYVCRAKWYRDMASFKTNAAPGQPAPGTWPYLSIVC